MQSAVSASTKINDHVGHCLDAVLSVYETNNISNSSCEISFSFMVILGGWKIYLDFDSLYKTRLTNQHPHITE